MSVGLSASARASLLALNNTVKLADRTQQRLSTGNKINSAVDGAQQFFQSRAFLQRAADFTTVKEGLATAVQSLRAASNAIDAITLVVQQMQGLTTQALNGDVTQRRAIAGQFNALVTQINTLVADATFNGVNLLTGTGQLAINFNESSAIELTVASINTTAAAGGINISFAAVNFSGVTQINAAVTDLATALSTLRGTASTLGGNLSLVETRQTFTDNLINTLQVASDNLVLADTNEEGLNLQVLQARQQLGVVALGVSGQQLQSILRLF